MSKLKTDKEMHERDERIIKEILSDVDNAGTLDQAIDSAINKIFKMIKDGAFNEGKNKTTTST